MAHALSPAEDRQTAMAEALRGLTAKQWRVASARGPFVAAHPGRRSGKTWLIPRMAAWAATRVDGGDIVLGAETLKKSKALFWPSLVRLAKALGWPVNSADGTVTSPWGAVIRLWGIKDDGAVALLRGFSIVECHFDEVATYARRLDTLIDDVIEPMLGEWRFAPFCGRCFLWGTPSHTRVGPWFSICEGLTPGWEVYHWDVRSNPHYPDPEGYLESVKARRGWTEANPTFQREYLGLFVDDAARLLIAYDAARLVEALPEDYDPKRWEHTLAVDFGLRHNSAWALLASDPKAREPRTYLVRVETHSGLLQDDAAAITLRYVQDHRVMKLVGDAHGLGAPYVEAWNRLALAPIRMEAADKRDKRGWIEVFNDDLRTGRLSIVRPSCGDWIDEACCLPWDEDRTGPEPGHCDDAVHAALYAFRHHRPFMTVERNPPEARASEEARIIARLEQEHLDRQRRQREGDWSDH